MPDRAPSHPFPTLYTALHLLSLTLLVTGVAAGSTMAPLPPPAVQSTSYRPSTSATSLAIRKAPAAPSAVTDAGTPLVSSVAGHFGSAVAVAGDVNGDGYSDLIVGAPDYSNGESGEGEVLLFLGGPSGYAASASWTYESNVAGASLGWSVAPAGDVNGDGYADVIVGAPNLSSNLLTNNGRAYVFLGGPSGLASSPAWTFDGDQGGQLLGFSVCTAGDIDGDGYDDVVIGSPGYYNIATPQDRAKPAAIHGPGALVAFTFNNGRAQTFLGGPSGLAASPQWDHFGFQVGGGFGYSVSTANDVNGDGYDDVVIGMPYGANLSTSVSQAGEFEVYDGGPTGLASTASAVGYGQGTNELRGFSVAGVGDIDGDGYADVAVGAPGYTNTAPNQGAVYVYRGSAIGLNLDWDFFDEGPVYSAAYPGTQFGYSVAPAGDVNGDGYADFVVGGPFYTVPFMTGTVNVGFMAVYEGKPTIGGSLNDSFAKRAFATPGPRGSELGYAVCTAGDEDGDGFSDVVAGNPVYAVLDGLVRLFRGGADMPQATPGWVTVAQPKLSGLIAAGDLNGDGYDDLALETDAQFDFYAGQPGELAGSPAWSFLTTDLDPQATSGSLTGAGDVDGDGYDDLFVNLFANGIHEAFWIQGGLAGPVLPPAWVAHGYIRSVGDVNGDGYSDQILIVPDTLYLLPGGPSGPAPTPSWSLYDPTQRLTPSPWPIGDVNGDGYGDVLLDDANYSGAFLNQGRALLYLGGPAGLAGAPSATYLGSQSGAYLSGYATGDLNGDGLADYVLSELNVPTSAGGLGRLTIHYGNDALPVTVLEGSSGGPTPYTLAFGGGLGDVNADGFCDLHITSDALPLVHEIYLGSAAGVSTNPSFSSGLGEQVIGSVFAPLDLNGDGFADLATMGAYSSDTVAFRVFYGNGAITDAPGLDRVAQQRRSSDAAPVSLLGLSDSPGQFRLAARGRSPAGRARVRMETDVKNGGAAFESNLGNLVHDAWSATGAPTALGSLVALDAVRALPTPGPTDKWRMRIATHSPYFPGGPWLSPVGDGRNEYDLRSLSSSVGVPLTGGTPPSRLMLSPPWPDPSSGGSTVAFSLPRRERVDLAVYDLAGRRVATLCSGWEASGRHEVTWNGRDTDGHAVLGGVYFARLAADHGSLTRKLVRMR